MVDKQARGQYWWQAELWSVYRKRINPGGRQKDEKTGKRVDTQEIRNNKKGQA